MKYSEQRKKKEVIRTVPKERVNKLTEAVDKKLDEEVPNKFAKQRMLKTGSELLKK
jgi:hypothetical protein